MCSTVTVPVMCVVPNPDECLTDIREGVSKVVKESFSLSCGLNKRIIRSD